MGGRPSNHLLRTLAAVPPGSRVLVLGEDRWGHASALDALGMVVECEATRAGEFDWVVAGDGDDPTRIADLLGDVRRALVPGGWAWIASSGGEVDAGRLASAAREAGLAESEAPRAEMDGADHFLCAIYRRVENDTIA